MSRDLFVPTDVLPREKEIRRVLILAVDNDIATAGGWCVVQCLVKCVVLRTLCDSLCRRRISRFSGTTFDPFAGEAG